MSNLQNIYPARNVLWKLHVINTGRFILHLSTNFEFRYNKCYVHFRYNIICLWFECRILYLQFINIYNWFRWCCFLRVLLFAGVAFKCWLGTIIPHLVYYDFLRIQIFLEIWMISKEVGVGNICFIWIYNFLVLQQQYN